MIEINTGRISWVFKRNSCQGDRLLISGLIMDDPEVKIVSFKVGAQHLVVIWSE